MKYFSLLLLITACTFKSENLIVNKENLQEVVASSHSNYMTSREEEQEYTFIWSDQLSQINDSSIAPVMKLLENRYNDEYPDFALLDWNNDGYKDLFFEYYASTGTGIKFRVDVYEYDLKTGKYMEEYKSFMNPSFHYDQGIITSHYWGHGGGFGVKYKVHNGVIDTLETININIIPYPQGSIKEVKYIYSQRPFKDSTYVSDTMIQLPPEYTYQKIIITCANKNHD